MVFALAELLLHWKEDKELGGGRGDELQRMQETETGKERETIRKKAE